ncbi:hypothetical protein [Pseudomonas sp. GM55]|uniref:hypothetical protein n=1 Tax=Pseudomonas sp. GM55 TaxID=1144333 RepID=UPI0012FCCBA6|nr:hypothetical protein [Pseudomonas sp. GM55]
MSERLMLFNFSHDTPFFPYFINVLGALAFFKDFEDKDFEDPRASPTQSSKTFKRTASKAATLTLPSVNEPYIL